MVDVWERTQVYMDESRQIDFSTTDVELDCFGRFCNRCRNLQVHQRAATGWWTPGLKYPCRLMRYHSMVLAIPSRRPVAGRQPSSARRIFATSRIFRGAPSGRDVLKTKFPFHPASSPIIVASSAMEHPVPVPTFNTSRSL